MEDKSENYYPEKDLHMRENLRATKHTRLRYVRSIKERKEWDNKDRNFAKINHIALILLTSPLRKQYKRERNDCYAQEGYEQVMYTAIRCGTSWVLNLVGATVQGDKLGSTYAYSLMMLVYWISLDLTRSSIKEDSISLRNIEKAIINMDKEAEKKFGLKRDSESSNEF